MPESVKKKDIICILCPKGCQITVAEGEKKGSPDAEGAECKKGKEYAVQESTDPRRLVCTSVKVKKGSLPLVSVKTDRAIPKDKIIPCLKELVRVEVSAPIMIGDIIVSDVVGTGVNIVATREISANNW